MTGPTVPERHAAAAAAGVPALTPQQEAAAALPAGAELPASDASCMALEMAVRHQELLEKQAADLVSHGRDGVNRALESGRRTDGLPPGMGFGLNHARRVWIRQADAPAPSA